MAESSHPPEPFQEIELPDGSDPISKGIVRRVRTHDGVVTVEVAVDGLGESLKERIVEQIRGAAFTLPEAEHVRIRPVAHEEKDVELPEVDHVIAVASAKGGVGKTTVSVGLARTLADRGLAVGLFDGDLPTDGTGFDGVPALGPAGPEPGGSAPNGFGPGRSEPTEADR